MKTAISINDFLAQFISNSLEKTENKLSPIEVEFLYLFNKLDKEISVEEIVERNQNMTQEHIESILKSMENKDLIIQGSSYKLQSNGREVFKLCQKLQFDIEPIIKSNPYYNNLYIASSTSIKM